MNNNSSKKPKTNRLLYVFLLLAGAYISYQIAALTRPDFVTETALSMKITDEMQVSGWFFRDEEVIAMPQAEAQYVRYEVSDCGRVASGSVIATLYETPEDTAASAEIAQLTKTITKLDAMLSRPGIGIGEVAELDGEIYQAVRDTADSAAIGDLSGAGETKEELIYLLTRRQLATVGTEPTQRLLDERVGDKSSLLSALGKRGHKVTSPAAGAFVSVTDGYESRFNPALCGTLTPAKLREMAAAPPADTGNALGKIIKGYDWRYVCIVGDADGKRLTVGKTYHLRFGGDPDNPILAVLENAASSEQDGYVLTFRSSRTSSACLLQRQQTAGIILTSYEGLCVNNEARRVVDGVTGVYVLAGMEMTFKPIETLYTTDSYTIVKWEPNKSGALRLYDEVILTGKEIYDGKIVQ
ncbi:MAG TPA: HlyD family efflux transporter periplasmic adaptor subunit [Candidatus Acidoferrum sp.]|nr:HlyD family efflux transporter periplasmic adaptor subunit [Candidatus Acidoferrum sp.]